MREQLDYRRWFRFRLHYDKGEQVKHKELTDKAVFRFSSGEKAMAMYVPLFSAAYSRYLDAADDAPRLITLDEAFAGVDEQKDTAPGPARPTESRLLGPVGQTGRKRRCLPLQRRLRPGRPGHSQPPAAKIPKCQALAYVSRGIRSSQPAPAGGAAEKTAGETSPPAPARSCSHAGK